jgi:hypoxanthine phosphoribosyltransferase
MEFNGKFKIRRTLLTSAQIQERVAEIGRQITSDYAGSDLVLVGVLKGSLYFLADLSRSIDLPITLDFMSIGTIPNTTSQTGIVRITKDLDVDIAGRQVLLIEDIIRTGLTTAYLVQN